MVVSSSLAVRTALQRKQGGAATRSVRGKRREKATTVERGGLPPCQPEVALRSRVVREGASGPNVVEVEPREEVREPSKRFKVN